MREWDSFRKWSIVKPTQDIHQTYYAIKLSNYPKAQTSHSYQICSWAWQSTQSPEGNWLHVCSWRWHGNSSWWFHSTQWTHRSAHPVECLPLWSRWCEWTHGAQTRTQWVGIHHHLWVVSMTMWQTSCPHQQFSVGLLVGRVDLKWFEFTVSCPASLEAIQLQ